MSDKSYLIHLIDKQHFHESLKTMGSEQLRQDLNLSISDFKFLLKVYECDTIIEQLKQEKRKKTYEQKAKLALEALLDKVDKDTFINYYINENHSIQEVCDYFAITNKQCMILINQYNCTKPKSLSSKLAARTKQDRYDTPTYNNRQKAKATCQERYGVDNPAQVSEFIDKSYQSKVARFGLNNCNNWKQNHITRINSSGSLAESYKITTDHRKQTLLERYSVDNISKLQSTKDKIKESVTNTFLERYGVSNYWLMPEAKRSNGSKNSSYNIAFATLLKENNIDFMQEVAVGDYIYDFKIDDYLIEINPAATHNITWNPFGVNKITEAYHAEKSINAQQHGYRCIHIWEWDDLNKLIKQLLLDKPRIYARNCIIKEVACIDAQVFINEQHLQNYAKDNIRIGLYHNNELVSIMTFGKPRYSLKADYELIRYCTSHTVIGGAQKLFNYFVKTYNPRCIVSYCDKAKFEGNVYGKLGFQYRSTALSHHWYNIKTKQHILDSLLRKRGFDQLFKTNFGKGTSNSQLMIDHGFVEVVDCGQSTYIWENNS